MRTLGWLLLLALFPWLTFSWAQSTTSKVAPELSKKLAEACLTRFKKKDALCKCVVRNHVLEAERTDDADNIIKFVVEKYAAENANKVFDIHPPFVIINSFDRDLRKVCESHPDFVNPSPQQ